MAVPKVVTTKESYTCNWCHTVIPKGNKAIQWKTKTGNTANMEHYHEQCYVDKQNSARENGLR
jgi:hypothetical protein